MPKLTNTQYDAAKDWVMFFIPGISTAVGVIGALWGVDPDLLTKIVGTITALNTLGGVFLKLSTNQYNKGDESDEG